MYTDASKLAQYMQRTFNAVQESLANDAILAAQSWVDVRTGRSYGIPSPVTEVLPVYGPVLYLKHKPVSSITQIQLRRGSVLTLLSAATPDWVLDARSGVLRLLASVYNTDYAVVTYEHSEGVPFFVEQATTILAAHLLHPVLNPIQQRVTDFTDSSGTRYKFVVNEVPAVVGQLLQAGSKVVVA